MSNFEYRPDIDGLRTIAVLPVVFYHAGLGFSGGFIGVDIFFVISGFLITSVVLTDIERNAFSLVGFYERRARRIFPALFAVFIATTAVATAIMLPWDLENYGKSAVFAAAFLANFWFYSQQGYFTDAAELSPLLHTWSLGVEEQFYFVFPLILLFVSSRLRSVWVFTLLVALLFLSLALSIIELRSDQDAAFYLSQFRFWELLIGSALAFADRKNWLDGLTRWPVAANLLAVCALVGISVAVFTYGPETLFPGAAALLPCIGAAIIIAVGAKTPNLVSKILSTSAPVFIGKISYSLYLWHWPVIAFAYYIGGEDLEGMKGVFCVAVALVLSLLSYFLIEQPFRNRAWLSQRVVLGSSILAMGAIVGFGAVLAKYDGLPGRMSQDLARLAEMRVSATHRECFALTPEDALAGNVCVRGVKGVQPAFVLVGDSHANALSAGFFDAAERVGLAGYQFTNPGFRPLPGASKQGEPEWGRMSDVLLDFLQARPEVRTIYITGFWEQQFSGYSYRHAGDIWFDADYDGSGSAYNRTATIGAIIRLADALPDRQIVILDDVPTGDSLDLRRVIREIRFGHVSLETAFDSAGLDAEDAAQQRTVYEGDFMRLAGSDARIAYEPIFETLCGPLLCPLFVNKQAMFADGDHLSHYGSLSLSPIIAAVLTSHHR
jgi:peptidoglycan/LPS O-acetylase OafA/YrhL